MKKIKIFLLTLLASVLVACMPTDLDNNLEKWKNLELPAYAFTLKEKCLECAGGESDEVRYSVIVVGDEVVKLNIVSGENPQWAMSIDDIFSELKDRLTEQEQDQITFDENFFYPRDTQFFEITLFAKIDDIIGATEDVSDTGYLSLIIWEETNTEDYTLTYTGIALDDGKVSPSINADQIKYKVTVRDDQIVDVRVLQVNSIDATQAQQDMYEGQARRMDMLYELPVDMLSERVFELNFDRETAYLKAAKLVTEAGSLNIFSDIEVRFD